MPFTFVHLRLSKLQYRYIVFPGSGGFTYCLSSLGFYVYIAENKTQLNSFGQYAAAPSKAGNRASSLAKFYDAL